MDAALETLVASFRTKVSEAIRIEAEGLNRFRVFTPFILDDGDHLAIVLRRDADGWVLSDEGNTFMQLTYRMEEKELQRGTRQKIVTNTLALFSVEDHDGELRLSVPADQAGDALYSFIQALFKIHDVTYLTRERVRSTFIEDFRAVMTEASEGTAVFDWFDKRSDPKGYYPVDCFIPRGKDVAYPLFVYALTTDSKVRDATIALLHFEKEATLFHSVGIFEDQEQVNRRVLARFTDVCEKQFSALTSNRDRIVRYVRESVAP